MATDTHSDPTAVSPELCLLLDCLWDPESKPDISGVDEEAFVRLIRSHRCVPLVQSALSRHHLKINPRLKSLAIKSGLCSTNLTEALNTIAQQFKAENIRFACVKGPALSQLAYGNTTSRQFYDLDLLVSQHDLPRAASLLLSKGYALREFASPLSLDTALATQRGVALQNPERTVYIDIGSVLISPALSCPSMVEAVLAESTDIQVADKRTIRTPGPDVMMIILCMHGAEDMWNKLSMVADVAALLQSHPETDWDVTLARAYTWGQARCTLVGMCLARDLLNATLPETIEETLKQDHKATALAQEAMQLLLSGQSLETGMATRARFELKTRERLLDRCRWLAKRLFTPSAVLLNAIPLPRCFGFLYWVLQPLRVLVRLGK